MTRQEIDEAIDFLHQEAEQAYAPAQNALGFMYFNGQGVPHSYTDAAQWYRRAAEQGYSAAQYNLGTMYTYGQGVSKDYVQAHIWHSLAADAGDPDAARERDMLTRRMTPEQRAEAERLVVEWKQKSAQQ